MRKNSLGREIRVGIYGMEDCGTNKEEMLKPFKISKVEKYIKSLEHRNLSAEEIDEHIVLYMMLDE